MFRTTFGNLVMAGGLVLAIVALASADTVWDARNLPYKGKVVDLTPDGLILTWDMNQANRPFLLSNIKKVELDDMPDLSAAEDWYVAGKLKEAIAAYLQVQSKAAGGRPWVKLYVSSRLVDCYGRSNQFAKAVKTYIELCQNPLGGALAAAVKLPAVMAKGSADNAAARKALDEALKAAPPNAPYIDSLNKLNVNIQMVEGDPAQVLAIVEADLKSKNIEVRDQARLRQFELLLKLDRIDDLSASVAQGWKEMDAEFWSSLYYYDGRCKYARKDFTHASMAFMHVPILYKSKKDMAALSLYWAAKSMTNIEEKEKKPPLSEIQMALREATEKYPGTEGAALAQKLLKELGGA